MKLRYSVSNVCPHFGRMPVGMSFTAMVYTHQFSEHYRVHALPDVK